MPLWTKEEAWRNPTVIADGWAMRVCCALCARDMSAETKGRAILQLPTEDPNELLVIISDEQGNLKTRRPEAVFVEEEAVTRPAIAGHGRLAPARRLRPIRRRTRAWPRRSHLASASGQRAKGRSRTPT